MKLPTWTVGILCLVYASLAYSQSRFYYLRPPSHPIHVRAEKTRILHIGDSQSYGPFGFSLNHYLRQDGNNLVATVARCGSTPGTYMDHHPYVCGHLDINYKGYRERGPGHGPNGHPEFSQMIQKFAPHFLVIQLGGNLEGIPRAHSRDQLRRFARLIQDTGKPCFWIGAPPGWARPQDRHNQVYDEIYEYLGGICQVFDSRQVVDYPSGTGDGRHVDHIRKWELVREGHCPSDCKDGSQRADDWAKEAAQFILRNISSDRFRQS